ncbi:MAG: TRAP transporter substrate-binding protein DctP [Candidatus Marinimicrobia bacterium]|nr:TRAP transporter substrate-binding protein DctP [Candidatus Neomarinimicrobiota bacterium]MCF7827954.1 TRAP transporter substrate-binding protein DctP [Candidatus Neomarinimicrobiota bacterium]MCF7879291.1 TRAP transporter substrate-binding protein DctP [Candidatus Neomarinimicrobiota bacterium]
MTLYLKKFSRGIVGVAVLGLILSPFTQSAAKPIQIKIATLVPKSTGYYEVLQDIATDWEKITNGEVSVRIYPGGVTGDERDMIRKMRIDQIQAAAVSTKGLQFIHDAVYGLNYPMMVQSWDELDWLRERIGPSLRQKFSDRGFELLFWADVGWIYFFSTEPIMKPADVKSLKLFTRATDFDDLELWRSSGFNPVPLTTSDVLPGLQTGLIDVVQAPAFLVLSSQWFGIANHMLNVKWAALSGGFVITNKAWERVPEQYREPMREAAIERSKRIKNEIRYNSDQAIDIMKKHGLVVHTPDEEMMEVWRKETESYYPGFKGVLVPDAMHERVMNLWPQLKEYRQSKQDSSQAVK